MVSWNLTYAIAAEFFCPIFSHFESFIYHGQICSKEFQTLVYPSKFKCLSESLYCKLPHQWYRKEKIYKIKYQNLEGQQTCMCVCVCLQVPSKLSSSTIWKVQFSPVLLTPTSDYRYYLLFPCIKINVLQYPALETGKQAKITHALPGSLVENTGATESSETRGEGTGGDKVHSIHTLRPIS